MAQRVITQFVSDLSGKDIADGEVRSIDFTYDGKAYRIDLTGKEASAFDQAMEQYIASATRVSAGRRSTSSAASKRSVDEAADIRRWALANGFKVSERGRISAEVREAYNAAH